MYRRPTTTSWSSDVYKRQLVNTAALLEAMETGKVSGYMTDFPTEAILGKPGIVCTCLLYTSRCV